MDPQNKTDASIDVNDILDVLIIGGGQAGLTMGERLKRDGHRFLIVDAGAGIGDAWRRRWDSLRLFTPAQYDSLPGMPFPQPVDTYPGKDDVAHYLERYASALDLPVRLNTTVTSLVQHDGVYVARAGVETFAAREVVIATGPFQVPFTPPVADGFDPGVTHFHSAEYRNPGMVPPGKVLVVGAANTGCQIALELSATRRVELSVGQRLPTIPQRPLGRDVWWWATRIGLDRVTATSRLGTRLAGRDQVIGIGPKQLARHHGIPLRGRVTEVEGRTVSFANGEAADYDVVIWATGFRTDHSWIDVPGVLDARGRLLHDRGITPSPGLYVLGLPWQHTRTSSLLGWVARDAAYLAGQISSSRDELAGEGTPLLVANAGAVGIL
jgi:putative flavoprotein involved in K+ transport